MDQQSASINRSSVRLCSDSLQNGPPARWFISAIPVRTCWF